MKRLLFILALLLTQSLAFAAGVPVTAKSPAEKLQIRMRQQNIQIQRDEKAGKLTKAQAKALKAQVEAIRKAEIADIKQNGTKTLTDDQVNQLNQQLNTLSKSIPIK
jgi:ribosome recycling factor